jgi:hypothetical protein
MGKKKKAVHRALQAAIESWLWRDSGGQEQGEFEEFTRETLAPQSTVRTELSATVFSGEALDWVRYLQTSRERRYERDVIVRIHLQRELRLVAFEAEQEHSRWLAELLEAGVQRLVKRIESKPNVLAVFHDLVFGNDANLSTRLTVRLSPDLPSDATREADTNNPDPEGDVRLVLHSDLAREVHHALERADPALAGEDKLGLAWPVISRLMTVLAYPSAPRDLFVAKINVQAKMNYLSINVLYDGKKSGTLVPSRAGVRYEAFVSAESGLPQKELMAHHPYFRMLQRLGFLLRGNPYSSYKDEARVVAREYLDTTYLRLSLAGAMPEIPAGMQPLAFRREGRKVKTAAPVLGNNGILDAEDLDAWNTVSGPLRDLGFTLLRQLGIGEFGRVYDVLNDNNPALPSRLALKVDRIVGKKNKAILEAEEAMLVGRALARSPHVIRLYDTGKLSGKRYTYHVLQLIDGDTLDNLIGVTGTEHASVSRPPSARLSEYEARQEFERAISSRGSELWRRRRIASPFTHALSPAMVLDLLTSVLLWLEEVHDLGYAINDLKNGNLMMSRRGQLKGIDLDSYAPVHSPKDKMTDFMFLAVSLILLLFSAPVTDRGRSVSWEELIESESRLRAGLIDAWPFGNVEALSDGRVTRQEMIDLLVDLVQRSRHLVYSKHPDLYSQDVVRLLKLKRRLLVEELVVD